MRNEHHFTVVGLGPSGAALSLFLAEKGHKLDIFEKRGNPLTEPQESGRSINLAISHRGLLTLNKLGLLDSVMELSIKMKGRMIHHKEGGESFQPYGIKDEHAIYALSRSELNKILVKKLSTYPSVKMHFHQRLEKTSFEEKKLFFNGDTHGHTFTSVIGADGSASALRDAIMEENKRKNTSLAKSELGHGYKELLIPSSPSGDFLLDKNALHIWPRHSFMLIALPNFDGSFTATLFLHQERFAKLTTPKEILSFFEEEFCDVMNLIPDLAEQFMANPVGHLTTLKCSPWSVRGDGLLIGDAAHAIVPFYGQGMNCSFEDCSVFAELWENEAKKGDDFSLEQLYASFFQLRKENADAIADMALENFVEMRDYVADEKFLFIKKIERFLMQQFGESFESQYALVTFTSRPYRYAKKIGQIQKELLEHLAREISYQEEKIPTLVNSKLVGEYFNYIRQSTAPFTAGRIA